MQPRQGNTAPCSYSPLSNGTAVRTLHYEGIYPIIAFGVNHASRQQSQFSPQSVQRDDVAHGIATADAAL